MKLLTDGRNDQKFRVGKYIDPQLAELDGEGAQQKIKQPTPHPKRESYGVWTDMPSSSFDKEKTYYRLPMLKEPVWGWSIPAYFYVGGASGAAAVLSAAAQMGSPILLRKLIRKGRLLSLSGIALSTLLLIYDLGRKFRFMNMLRVFRPTSPMNMGSWILTSAGAFTTGALLYNGRNKFLKTMTNISGIGSGISGILLAGYTGVLLSYSAVPLWQEARKSLPLLFIASGISGASSSLELMRLKSRETSVVHIFSTAGIVAELLAARALEEEIKNYKPVEDSLKKGNPGKLWKAGRLMSLAALALSLLPGKSKARKAASAILEGAGAVSMRFAIYKAGQVSSRDPKAIFELQRGKEYHPKGLEQKEHSVEESTLEEMA